MTSPSSTSRIPNAALPHKLASSFHCNPLPWLAAAAAAFSAACGDGSGPSRNAVLSENAASADPTDPPTLAKVRQELVIDEGDCQADPRVQLGLVSEDVCLGAKVFFEETFDGNGRTCGTCHRAENNYTLDADFIAQLPADDPLFVGAPGTVLDGLESVHLTDGHALIKEHVDGFEDEPNKFALRSVPHLLSIVLSLRSTGEDGNRLGWSGDAVSDGDLESFLEAGIKQHLATRLERVAGVDFRVPTAEEKRVVKVFQRQLGRVGRMQLPNVQFSNPLAQEGLSVFERPESQCSECHANASARFTFGGRDLNFNTGVDALFEDGDLEFPTFAGRILRDGGSGGQGSSAPNFPEGAANSFGNGKFNTASVIEAADTGPWFHNNGVEASTPGGMLDLVNFYATPAEEGGHFNNSPQAPNTGLVEISEDDRLELALFLRAINAAFNLNMAIQRLEAAKTIATEHGSEHAALQRGLVLLGEAEVDDALLVLGAQEGPQEVQDSFYFIEQSLLRSSKTSLAAAVATPSSSDRLTNIENGLSLVRFAFLSMGTGLDMPMGEGNLMF